MRKIKNFDVINGIVLTLFALITVLPVLHVASKAFSGEGDVIAGLVTFYPRHFQLDTVLYVIGSPQFLRSLLVSVFVTGTGVALAMFLSITAAYPLSKPDLPGRKIFLLIYILVMLLQAGMLPTYLVYRSLHLTNTVWALIFAGAFSVYNMLIIKNFFEALPESIEEAAKIDGASTLQILIRIVIPMSMPVLATMILFYGVAFWNDYTSGVIYISDASKKPLQQYLYDLIIGALSAMDTAGNIDADTAMNLSGESVRAATIVVSTIPVLILYPLLQKYFVKGITIGSVKG